MWALKTRKSSSSYCVTWAKFAGSESLLQSCIPLFKTDFCLQVKTQLVSMSQEIKLHSIIKLCLSKNTLGIIVLHYSVTLKSYSLTTVSWPTENFYWNVGNSEASEGFYRSTVCLLMNIKDKEGNVFSCIFRMHMYLHMHKKCKGWISMFFAKAL